MLLPFLCIAVCYSLLLFYNPIFELKTMLNLTVLHYHKTFKGQEWRIVKDSWIVITALHINRLCIDINLF